MSPLTTNLYEPPTERVPIVHLFASAFPPRVLCETSDWVLAHYVRRGVTCTACIALDVARHRLVAGEPDIA